MSSSDNTSSSTNHPSTNLPRPTLLNRLTSMMWAITGAVAAAFTIELLKQMGGFDTAAGVTLSWMAAVIAGIVAMATVRRP